MKTSRFRLQVFVSVASFLAFTNFAIAYLVGPAVSLDELTEKSDIIFKGTAISSEPVKDSDFEALPAFGPVETKFKVVSVIKGNLSSEEVEFRHYDFFKNADWYSYEPQHYHFEKGRTYIVCAKKVSRKSISLQQIWMNHTGMEHQGVLLSADAKPVTSESLKALYWAELVGLLKSDVAEDAIYALKMLDEFSKGKPEQSGLDVYERLEVLGEIAGVMQSKNAQIAQAAIRVVGSGNPYLSEERAPFWLATVGDGVMPGLAQMNREMENGGGAKYTKELVAIANGKREVTTRTLAILALGLTRDLSVEESLQKWLKDSAPEIRGAATVLLADFPNQRSETRLQSLAKDSSPEVRKNLTKAIGFSQDQTGLEILDGMLVDEDSNVRRFAAMNLLSFSSKIPKVKEIFEANLTNQEFNPLFLNALAQNHPEKYLDRLAQSALAAKSPSNWWGGTLPSFESWQILFKFMKSQSTETIAWGKYEAELKALELFEPNSSSQPCDLYAFYVNRGLMDRAKAFRAGIKSDHLNLKFFFDKVDENPANFQ